MKVLRIIALPLIGLLLTVFLIRQARTVAPSSSTAPTTAEAAAPKSVRAEGRVVTYPGAQSDVGSDVDGTVTSILVKEDDKVRRGQVIATLRSDDLHAQLAEAQATVAEADADIRLYEVELNRAQQLYDARVGTREALDRAQRDIDAATARRATALAGVKRFQALIDKTVILSPIDGTVTARDVEPGEAVKAGQAVVTIADLHKTRIEAEVDEFDAGRIAMREPVVISAEGYNASDWKGTVEEIPGSVTNRRLKPLDPGRPTDTRVLLVKVAFDEATPLKLGQRVELEFTPEPSTEARK